MNEVAAYRSIAPPPENPQALADPELGPLARVWFDRRAAIEQGGQLSAFLTRLKREWAIETGLIERLYVWDRGVTEVLIEQGLDEAIIRRHAGEQSPHAAAIIHDQAAVIEGLFGYIKGELPLSETFIRQLHAELTRSQPTTEAIDALGRRVEVALQRGEYKRLPNNPRRPDGSVHVYCPPERVPEEMARLVEGARRLESEGAPPEVFAAWLHHAFTQIHPFQDGNGRVARALASLIFLRAGLFPLIVRDAQRSAYIEALERADAGDLAPLIRLFARAQREAILQALGLAHATSRGERLMQELARTLQREGSQARTQRQRLDVLSQRLFADTVAALQRWREELQRLLDDNAPPAAGWSARLSQAAHGEANDFWFRHQIFEAINALPRGHFVNFAAYRAWVRLALRTDEEFNWLVSLHGYGSDTGLRAVGSVIFTRALAAGAADEGGREAWMPARPAMVEPFLFGYHEAEEALAARYAAWLGEAKELALAEWLKLLRSV